MLLQLLVLAVKFTSALYFFFLKFYFNYIYTNVAYCFSHQMKLLLQLQQLGYQVTQRNNDINIILFLWLLRMSHYNDFN